MKNAKFIFLLMLLAVSSHCMYSQKRDSLDSVFEINFAALDSVVRGEKQIRQLTTEQNAFMYLIDSWSGSNLMVNFTGHLQFTKKDISNWRTWYREHSRSIYAEDFHKTIEVYSSFFKTGFISDKEIEYLEMVSKKYHSTK